jgi:hypothetical protein
MLGVIMLDTAFTRFPGDIGCAEGLAEPVLYERVPGATAARVVGSRDGDAGLEPFVAAGERLIARGADRLTTSCGFLVLRQAALAARLSVPIATSALLLAPLLQRLLPSGRRLGILTFSAPDLTPAHLDAAGAAPDTPVAGLPMDGVFRRSILGTAVEDSFEAREREVVDTARRLVAHHPDIGLLLFECTNLPPHRRAVIAATGRPVFDIWSLVATLTAVPPSATRGAAGAQP